MKIVNYIVKEYKKFIPVMVGLVLLVTIFFFYREYKYDNTRNKEETEVFQYFSSEKIEYKAIITRNLKNKIIDVTAKDKKITYDSTPIYYNNEEKVLFPSQMSVVFPHRDGSQYKIFKNSLFYKDGDILYINNDNEVGVYNNFFIFDGRGLYFFPEEGTLLIDNKEYQNLGKMSSIRIDDGYTLIVYDYEKDAGKIIDITGKSVEFIGKNYSVLISEKAMKVFNKRIQLFNTNNLNALFKTIDK